MPKKMPAKSSKGYGSAGGTGGGGKAPQPTKRSLPPKFVKNTTKK